MTPQSPANANPPPPVPPPPPPPTPPRRTSFDMSRISSTQVRTHLEEALSSLAPPKRHVLVEVCLAHLRASSRPSKSALIITLSPFFPDPVATADPIWAHFSALAPRDSSPRRRHRARSPRRTESEERHRRARRDARRERRREKERLREEDRRDRKRMRDSGDLAHMSHPDSDLEAYDAQRREKRRRTCLSDAAEQRADILLCDRCKSEIRMYDRRESDRRGSDRRGSERRGGERRSSQRLAPERRGSERHEDSRRYRERRSDTYKDHDVDQDDHQGHSRRDLENRGRPRRDNGHHDSHDDDHDDDHGDDHLRDHHRPQNDPKNGQPQEYHRQEWKRRDGKRRDSDNRDAEFRSNERRDDENGDAASLRDPDRRDAEIHPGKSTVGESRDSAPASRKGRDEDVRGGKVREDAPESNARHEIQGRDVHYQNGERVNRERVKSDWKSLGDMHSPLRDRSPGRDRSLTRSAVFPFRRGQERSRGAGLRRPAAQEREDEYDRRPWDNNSSTPKNIGQRDANDDFPSRIDYASKSAHPDSDILRRNPRSPLSQDRPQSLKEASLTNRLPSVLRNADHNRGPVVGNLPNDRNNESRKDKPAKTSGRPSSQILQHLRSKVMASLSKTS